MVSDVINRFDGAEAVASPGGPVDVGETFIGPESNNKHYWIEVWRFRDLLYFFAWRDILVHYKQTMLGIGWSVVKPLLNVLVYTVAFGILAGLPAKGTPYGLLVLAGLLPWQFFANSLSESSNAIIKNAALVGKMYFPRIILPVAALASGLVEFAIGFVLLLGAMGMYGIWPTWRILLLPLFLLPVLLLSLGIGIWTSALYVRYRDVRFLIPFLIQAGFFVTPIGYLTELVPKAWRWAYSFNPLVGSVEAVRWATLGPAFSLDPFALSVSVIGSVVAMFVGIMYFRSVEREFADII
ncbi:MAG: ABC transporter permease [Xanthobacteraceae bacterium]